MSLKDKEATAYTDSRYAFGVVHTFGKIWAERRLINSKGQDLVHKELIIRFLEISCFLKSTIDHVPGHQ
jgi:ribonuclease HI